MIVAKPSCSFCPDTRLFASSGGIDAFPAVLAIGGEIVAPAVEAVPDTHWCRACWVARFATRAATEASHAVP